MSLSQVKLKAVHSENTCALYEVPQPPAATVRRLILTTPQTRSICNDPLVAGICYTRALQQACTWALRALRSAEVMNYAEARSIVFHILRGGLNFGLREALYDAFGFVRHGSAFVSAQRARSESNPQDWIITESAYQKLYLHNVNQIVFGDVVATGTSLEYALKRLLEAAQGGHEIESVTFFTIGSPRSYEILEAVDHECRARFSGYRGSVVVFIEGIFQTATVATPMHIKIDGTDLLRRDCVMAPEFIESNYESPSFPLERCTIYDAGSRAFDLPEYFHDVTDYWRQTLALAEKGLSFQSLLAERFPELDGTRFGSPSLKDVCQCQLEKLAGK